MGVYRDETPSKIDFPFFIFKFSSTKYVTQKRPFVNASTLATT